MEEFKDAVGYEDYFMVSNTGKIHSKRTNRLLKLYHNKSTGYLAFATMFGGKNGLSKCLKPHRLVAETFIPRVCGKEYVNHKDGNKLNNSLENLEWCTLSENSQHAWNNGLSTVTRNYLGDHYSIKFIPSIRKEIYDLYDTGKYSMRSISKIYCCSHTLISRLVDRQGY